MPDDIRLIVARFKSLRDPKGIDGMARFGIRPDFVYGIKIPVLRRMGREIGTNQELSGKLWQTGSREGQILASMIADPSRLSGDWMDEMAATFSYWEICDQCCMNLFEKNTMAWKKAVEWSGRNEEFVKRAGFVLMARLAVSDKQAGNERFYPFFPIIIREAIDDRNYVKKAVNWALRQIGKRNRSLHKMALQAAAEIAETDSKSASWVAGDAIRELNDERVMTRLINRP